MFKNEKINSIKKMITSVEEDLETVFSELLSILKKICMLHIYSIHKSSLKKKQRLIELIIIKIIVKKTVGG